MLKNFKVSACFRIGRLFFFSSVFLFFFYVSIHSLFCFIPVTCKKKLIDVLITWCIFLWISRPPSTFQNQKTLSFNWLFNGYFSRCVYLSQVNKCYFRISLQKKKNNEKLWFLIKFCVHVCIVIDCYRSFYFLVFLNVLCVFFLLSVKQ